MSELLANLNEEQTKAVTWPQTPLLIVAGAGSGKTRILVHRIAWMISQGVPAYQVLGVTFTNKAANEMKSRVQRLVQQEVWVSTFHSTCVRILRQEATALKMDRSFTIYDDSDQMVLLKESLQELKVVDKQFHPRGILERIQRAKDDCLTAEEYSGQVEDYFDEIVAKAYKLYEAKLMKLNACDFGDLIFKTVKLYEENPQILQSWQRRFQTILIDEYQDTNHAQYRLVHQLTGSGRQITVVGDPDQSIYSWRGADIQNIMRFEEDYPECGIIKLERNYRSTATILDAANELIRHNTFRKPKNLWTEREDGEKITVYEALDERHEGEYLVSKIQDQLSQGKRLAHMVVFYRVHAQSRPIEDSLRRSGIPYKIVGGTRFYDRKEIKDLVAYLRLTNNSVDDLSLKRVLNVPPRGIGKKTFESLEQAGARESKPLYEILKHSAWLREQSPKVQKSVASFVNTIEAAKNKIDCDSVEDIATFLLDRSGYLQSLRDEKSIEAQARIENIQEFFSVIQDFENEEHSTEIPTTKLALFLESISLVTDLDTWDQSSDVLTLMSLHTAKGLEFPMVFMTVLE